MDWFDLLAVQGTHKSLLQHHSLKASILQHSFLFMVQLLHPYMITAKTLNFDSMDFCSQSDVSVTGVGNGNPFQYSCLENPMTGEAWQATVHGVTNSQTRLGDFTFPFHFHALEKEMATHSSVLA